jgi:predicted dehydrogenase
VKTWRVAVIGYGWAAGAHLTALTQLPHVEVAAVCTGRADVDAGRLQHEHGRPIEVVRDLETVLSRRDVDVIDICSRSELHAAQGVAAARAGKHVIIEKPVALHLDELRDLTRAVAESAVRSCVCFNIRFSPQFAATRALLDGDLIGPLHYAEVDYFHEVGTSVRQYEWNRLRVGGGSSLLSVGCHSVDALLAFMGSPVEEVSSYATASDHPVFARYEYPTSSVTILRFANGAVGKVASVMDAYQPYYFRVHLVGRDGVILDGKLWSSRIAGHDPDRWTELGVRLESSADVVHHSYEQQFRAFFDAIAADHEMPQTSLAEAARAFEVVFAADRSAAIGRPVRLDEVHAA